MKNNEIDIAIKNTKRRMADFYKGGYKVSEYNSDTTIYILVEELKRYLEE